MKEVLFIILFLILGGCANVNETGKKETSKSDTVITEDKKLKFVVAPQYEGKTSELIEFGKKLIEEHPEVGNQGEVTLYYSGSTYTFNEQEYAVFMILNKTDTDINHDAKFKISWSYAGQQIYQNELVEYKISENGELPTQSATIFLLPLTTEQNSIVTKIVDERKMNLSISDIQMK
jgi:putative lipoprotein